MNFYLPGIQPAKESKQTIIWWCCLFKKPTYSWLQHHYPLHHSSLIILADVGPSIPVKMLVPLFGITLLQLGFHWCFCINLSRSCANTFYKEYCNTMGDTFYEFETLFFAINFGLQIQEICYFYATFPDFERFDFVNLITFPSSPCCYPFSQWVEHIV